MALAEFGVSALGMWHPPRLSGTLVFRGAEGHRDRALESRTPSVTNSERYLMLNVYEILE